MSAMRMDWFQQLTYSDPVCRVLHMKAPFAMCEVAFFAESSAVQQVARQKLNFNGKVQAVVFRQVVVFQSASDQASSNSQSVNRSTISRTSKTRSWLADAIDGSQRRDYGIGSLSSETVTPAQSPVVEQGNSSLQSSERQSRKNEGPQNGGGSSDSWSTVSGSRPPLTAEEEAEYASHVQDLLALEAKRDELEKQLGRTPTHQEWADYMGISVFLLYARQGRGRAAKRKMVESNILLVHFVAQQFHGRGLSHDDLCQQGVLGLLNSTEKFDSTRNTKFSSYAFFGVQNQMRIAAEKFGHALRIGQNVYANVSSLLRHKDDFLAQHGRQPTSDELEEVSKMSANKIRKVFQAMLPVKSLEQSEASSCESRVDGRNPHFLQLRDSSPTSHPWLCARDEERNSEVIKALSSLTSHQQQIMRLRFGLGGEPPLSRSEVALVLGISSVAVFTTEKRALERLRDLALEEGFMNYLNDSFWLK
ncbi:hypothetical protein KC19_7G173200 [Ceratodon purpureus]|uniref:Uncharacterized protein n=1 Tax=Ceratodon purpureus TaxID=3225 RepID=A0A8T0H7M2_CERPU|nr:hypothetical protein KC19_7G173200 [Ceratodon purpureus]